MSGFPQQPAVNLHTGFVDFAAFDAPGNDPFDTFNAPPQGSQESAFISNGPGGNPKLEHLTSADGFTEVRMSDDEPRKSRVSSSTTQNTRASGNEPQETLSIRPGSFSTVPAALPAPHNSFTSSASHAISSANASLHSLHSLTPSNINPLTSTLSCLLLARVSTMALITKAWKPLYVVLHLRECTLSLYRNETDRERGLAFAKKTIWLDHNFRASAITCKEYSKQKLHHFSVEELLDFGPSLKVKFAAEEKEYELLLSLRAGINRVVAERKKARVRCVVEIGRIEQRQRTESGRSDDRMVGAGSGTEMFQPPVSPRRQKRDSMDERFEKWGNL